MIDSKLAGEIAAATAACGMTELANWLPADRHPQLQELLHDLTIGALHAYADGDVRRVPSPSKN